VAAAIKQLKQLIEELQRQLSELQAQISRESHMAAKDATGASSMAAMTLSGQVTGIESAMQVARSEIVQMMIASGETTGLISDSA
jgi:cell division septum initiation protein DivIVA